MDPLQAWADAHSREQAERILFSWWRTFFYRWADARIVHPMPRDLQQQRQRILDAGYRWLSEHR